MPKRQDLRNIAIIAHVDHGKTTLVDAMLVQTGALNPRAEVSERILDTGDLEREKGITILAKHTVIHYQGITITIVDTPGHADFGGEVERALAMVDGVLLLVDASEGPLPQTRFVLHKALQARLPVIVVVNKVDRPDARVAEVVRDIEELFLDLGADEHQIDFPVLYASGRAGLATRSLQEAQERLKALGSSERSECSLDPLFETMIEVIPPPEFDQSHPFQARVTNLDADPYLGRLAICRVRNGRIERGQQVAWCKLDGSIERVKVVELFESEGLDRTRVDSAGPGEIVAVAGIAQVTIGETLADADDPRPMAPIAVEEPSLSMTIGVNTSPLAGAEGSKLTARLIKNRLDAELLGNVSLRLSPTERPDAWEVQGRGELQLAVLVETMRREGFELTVGKPRVITRVVDGVLCEPMEQLVVDVPEDYVGVVTQLLGLRRAEMVSMANHGSGWSRLEYRVPARGLVGFRTEFLTETRGTGIMHHVFSGWAPWCGELRTRRNGSMVADRRGVATAYALMSLQERGTLFIGPGTEVYEGMIVGENSRPDEMDVNPVKEKKQTNMRSSTSEVLERLAPHTEISLEAALELISPDECVEVTPKSIRLRKVELSKETRGRLRGRARREQLA